MTGSFSEDEARQIFARAAERQHAVESRGEGLSLDELQAIGREAGLDSAHVAAAVAELRAGPAPTPVLVGGVDLTPRRVRVLPAELTDALWEAMVGRLRRTFGAKGIPSEVGRTREWTSGPTSNLHVVAEPVEGGTRITISTSRREDAQTPAALGWGGAGLAAFFLILGAAGGKLADPILWVFVVGFLVLSAVGVVATRRSLARWSARRTAEFDGLLDAFEHLAPASGPALAPTPLGTEAGALAPRLDLDALPDPGTEPGDPSPRARSRA